MPRLATGYIADSLCQLAIVHARRCRFEARELVKLLDRSSHYETATRVVVAELVLMRNNVAVLIRKHGPVGEAQSVSLEIKAVAWPGVSCGNGDKNPCNPSARSRTTHFQL